jgi:hypothetical protein
MKVDYLLTTVTYQGQEFEGLCVKSQVQRVDEITNLPEDHQCIGKQRYPDGLRLVFIPKSVLEKISPGYTCKSCGRRHSSKQGWVSSHKCGVCIKDDIENLKRTTHNCFQKDSSESHKNWLLHIAIHNMGFNNRPEEAETIINDNWR